MVSEIFNKKFTTFHRTRRFMIVFTNVSLLCLYWPIWTHFKPIHFIFKSTLNLSSHLHMYVYIFLALLSFRSFNQYHILIFPPRAWNIPSHSHPPELGRPNTRNTWLLVHFVQLLIMQSLCRTWTSHDHVWTGITWALETVHDLALHS